MQVLYDGSFEGFLCVIFNCYSQKIVPDQIVKAETGQETLFEPTIHISTSPEQASRVWNALQKKLPRLYRDLPLTAFLSETEAIELRLYRFIRYCFSCKQQASYGHPDFIELVKINRKVQNEAMRTIQFVRFQQLKNGIYFSLTAPVCNVLPLTVRHFQSRFADQQWMIYDQKRKYGIYYNLQETREIQLSRLKVSFTNGMLPENLLEEEEINFQQLWKNYFEKLCIEERKNLKLQRSHMPARFWKYLPEKFNR